MSRVRCRISGISKESVVDGEGLRYTVFFQGCKHACPGCQNPETWDINGGEELDLQDVLNQIPVYDLISGVTLSGGDPFFQAPAASELAACFQRAGLNVWVYTGFTWEQLQDKLNEPGYEKLLRNTNVLVDGRYMQTQRDLAAPYRGSSNQRLIDVAQSFKEGKAVEYKLKGDK